MSLEWHDFGFHVILKEESYDLGETEDIKSSKTFTDFCMNEMHPEDESSTLYHVYIQSLSGRQTILNQSK